MFVLKLKSLFLKISVLKTTKKFGINRSTVHDSKENGADERRARACGTATWGMWVLVELIYADGMSFLVFLWESCLRRKI